MKRQAIAKLLPLMLMAEGMSGSPTTSTKRRKIGFGTVRSGGPEKGTRTNIQGKGRTKKQKARARMAKVSKTANR